MSQWGEPRSGWLSELVQFAAFVFLFIVIIIAVTAVGT